MIMTTSAVIMMVVYLAIVGGGLAVGIRLMSTHDDETSGDLGTSSQ
ncbi:methionine/alanine import family NSS transporter small subunit [Arcanobacterium pinnipediorum]|uniref:Methionine/alanine import family NSS transporter small subunit n=1 Tax=Arcanobacterium pinnipediorum TaxID=1503041 RepID=A0ABY5AGH7_9ACTO|nr:methionine/alanine import family NSS transporter small subunit [Arcanobacterium pinnipediorum]USR79177.1 methionine/alanine import family NSS transporter small subunit [Arcanobacterium pinnipediorum]